MFLSGIIGKGVVTGNTRSWRSPLEILEFQILSEKSENYTLSGKTSLDIVFLCLFSMHSEDVPDLGSRDSASAEVQFPYKDGTWLKLKCKRPIPHLSMRHSENDLRFVKNSRPAQPEIKMNILKAFTSACSIAPDSLTLIAHPILILVFSVAIYFPFYSHAIGLFHYLPLMRFE